MRNLLLVLVALFLLPSMAVAQGRPTCSTTAVTDSLDLYVPIGRWAPVSVSFEPDALGIETIAELSLQMCSREVDTSCLDYDFDSDADGVGDTNILTGATIVLSGVKDIRGFNFLRIQSSTNPSGTDDPEVSICRDESD